MDGQRLFHPFSQTARRARIEIHQFPMQDAQRLLGCGIIFHRVGRVQLFRNSRFLFIGQMIEHVSSLVDLAALDRCRLTGVFLHRSGQRLAAV